MKLFRVLRSVTKASIQASSMCVFWEVTQERAMTILDRFPEERQLFSSVIATQLQGKHPFFCFHEANLCHAVAQAPHYSTIYIIYVISNNK